MARWIAILLIAVLSSVNAFAPSKTSFLSQKTALSMAEERKTTKTIGNVERGVSVDQDGKSNVWAIEPKMEIDTKSNEEKTSGALIAVAGLAGFGVVAAGILTNLPDPTQF